MHFLVIFGGQKKSKSMFQSKFPLQISTRALLEHKNKYKSSRLNIFTPWSHLGAKRDHLGYMSAKISILLIEVNRWCRLANTYRMYNKIIGAAGSDHPKSIFRAHFDHSFFTKNSESFIILFYHFTQLYHYF